MRQLVTVPPQTGKERGKYRCQGGSLLFCIVQDPSLWNDAAHIRVSLPVSINPVYKLPHKYAIHLSP